MAERIAIIGSACRFPGGSSSPSKLWELLRDPQDVLSEFPPGRLNLARFYNENGEYHGSTDVMNKSYLLSEDPRLFDASFFNINPVEADGMDPQQRMLLETVYEALESAGCTLEQIQGSMASVYVGLMNADYSDIQWRDTETMPSYIATGTARSILSNRISYFFDLKGPSMTIDTACSSSLVALHQAVQSLRNGESATAIVAGANLLLDPSMYVAESKLHMLSPGSRCRMWDESADGYARGEGFAALFLKRLSDALEAGDHIECVVRETGVNSDGRTKGITMPNAIAQAALIRETYLRAGLDPISERCQYFECHGTGTLAGDPIEAQAIKEAFFPTEEDSMKWPAESKAPNTSKLLVGSIKTVIGHLEGCAGLAGVLKAVLAIKHRTVPPNMHFNVLNPAIAPYYEHLHIPTSSMPWPEVPGTPLRASVNSFGFGGTNAHAIIESYDADADAEGDKDRPKYHQRTHSDQHSHSQEDGLFVGPLTFSANAASSLLATVKGFANYIKFNPSVDLADLTWVVQSKRTTFPIKTSFSGATRQRLLAVMDQFVENAEAGSSSCSSCKVEVGTRAHSTNNNNTNEVPGILGIFTGQGAQWASMGRELILSCRVYRESIERCEAALACLPVAPPQWSLKQELMADEAVSRLSEATIAQPLCTATQIAVIDLLSSAGIKFDAVVGHSSGEIAAAYAAGILSLTDAIRIAYYRGYHVQLAQSRRGQSGAMMAVGLSFDAAISFCAKSMFSGRICVAACNSPSSVTLSGDADAVTEAKDFFDKQNISARLLRVDTAYHSHHMLPCSENYLGSLEACNIRVSPPRRDCIWVSSVRGDSELIEGDLQSLKGQYWIDNMLQTVLFSQAVECSLWNGGPFDIVIEVGPHPALKGPVMQTLKSTLGSTLPYIGFMERGANEVETFSGGVGYVWSHLGPSFVDFDGYRKAFQPPNSPNPKLLKDLPSYEWDHDKIHWRESRISRNYRLRDHQSLKLLGRRVPDDSEYEMRWRNILRLNEIPWVKGHEFQGQVIFPAAGYVSMALEASTVIAEGRPVKLVEIQDMDISRAVVISGTYAGVEITFTIHRNKERATASDSAVVNAKFACYACSDETVGTLEKTCSGRLLIHLGRALAQELPPRSIEASKLATVDVERFYDSLARLGLNYQSHFRRLISAKRSMGYASASASWPDTNMGQEYMIHPVILDAGFQSIFAALSSVASDSLYTPYLPIAIRRLAVDPNLAYCNFSGEVKVDMDAFITNSSSRLLEGDVHLFDSQENHTIVQVEGLTLKGLSEPAASNDRQLFAETIWDIDISTGLVDLAENKENIDDGELVDGLERACLYYFQALFREIEPDEIKEFKWYHQRLFEAVDILLESIRNGQHPVVKREWLEDSRETVLALIQRFPEQIDFQLLRAIGENLVSVVRGETQLLEVMLQSDMLNRYYREGCAFKVINAHIAQAVKQITHKHPQAKILEIGAGTGATTTSVLDIIGNAYFSYTFTDISHGFFESASEKFRHHSSKIVFKLLDVERDVAEQGYEEHAYDIIVAANVLHATRKLTDTLQQVRSLLKPGGYLVLMEVTGDLLRMPFMMGGLPGWWLGGDEGRRLSPAISPVKWNELLQATGFTGIDAIRHDMPDIVKHSCSMILSQAVDEKFELLRDPLSSIDMISEEQSLLIIGGKSLPVVKVVRDIQKLLSSWKHRIIVADSIENLDARHLPPKTSIICLQELDKPLFSDHMTSTRFRLLQELFIKAKNVLWITAGRISQSPLSNMTVGIGRALRTELPHVNLQFLDVDRKATLNARVFVEVFLKLALPTVPEYTDYNMLWTMEPEIALEGDMILIPRVVPSKTLNDRFNASRRPITKKIATNEVSVEIVSSGKSLSLTETRCRLNNTILPGYTSIRVGYSIALPYAQQNPCYLCLGVVHGTERTALAISRSNSTVVEILSDDVFVLAQTEDCDPTTFQAVAGQLVARTLFSIVPKRGSILFYEPEKIFAIAVMHNSHWIGRDIFFATSKQTPLPRGWIPIHPQASQRAIKHDLPGDIACLIDFSNSDCHKIKSCLSQNCAVAVFEPSMLDGNNLSLTRNSLLAESYREATTCLLDLGHSTIKHIMPVENLSGASSSAIFYPNVVNWSQSSSMTVRIKPVEAVGLFSSTKTYFMVGMTGELGLSLCRWMVENGARYFVLASRNVEINALWLGGMHKLGVTVRVHKMDVSNRDSLHSVYNIVRDTMPPIAGVCNAAMVLSDKLFVDMSADTMNNTLKPKVDGTRYLDELFSENTLDFFILFSSLGTVVGNGGQSNYHAANLFMAGLAAQRKERGLVASVIHIGMVVDIGYVARTGRTIEDHLRKLFFMPLSESDVHHLFAEAVLAGRAGADGQSEIIMGIEPFRNSPGAKIKPPWLSNPRFSHFVLEENGCKEQRQTSSINVHIRQKLEDAESEDSATAMLQEAFSLKLESMMQLAPNTINLNVPLLDLGCDSLVAVEIRTWFLKEIHVDVPVLKVLSGDTVAEICNDAARSYLASKFKRAQGVSSNLSIETKHVEIKDIDIDICKVTSMPLVNCPVGEDDNTGTSDPQPDSNSTEDVLKDGTTTDNLNSEDGSSSTDRTTATSPVTEILEDSFGDYKNRNMKRVEKMSYPQSRIWFLTHYLRDPTTYNITVAYDVKGILQVSRFRRALSTVISRHESLQTCFFAQPDGGELMQGVLTSPSPSDSLKHIQTADPRVIECEFSELKHHTWELEQGRTFRATLISRAPDLHTIIFGYHHIIMDVGSWHVFLRDLDLAYQMRPLKRAPKQYIDFAGEQIRSFENGDFASQIEFWRHEHARLPSVMPLLPIARVRARRATDNYHSHTTSREIDHDLVAKIKRASQALRATPFHFYLAAIQVLIFRFLDIQDLCIGVADANRTNEDIAETVGFFINLLPLRFQVNRIDQFSDLIQRTSKKVFSAMTNSNVPFDLVLEKLNVHRSSAYSPLFQVVVNYRMGSIMQARLGDCLLELTSAEDARNPYDLGFGITKSSNGTCLLQLTCRDYLYTPEASNLLMDTYVCLLQQLSTNTSIQIQECTLFDSTKAGNAISIGKGPRVNYDWPATLSEAFDVALQVCGNNIAIKDSFGSLTYSQLAEQVNSIAAAILDRTLTPESRIAVLCQPSAGSIACMLAILRTGCVYVPLDLSLPQARHATILDNCRPSLMLCQPATLGLARGYSLANTSMSIVNISELYGTSYKEVNNMALPNLPAFLLYTSGSTGIPKGIFLSQAGFVNHIAVKTTQLSLDREVVLQQSSFGFDMSIVQTFCALANGGTLVVVPQQARGDPVEISKLMLMEMVTLTIATPSEYLMYLRYGKESLKQNCLWRNACLGGEIVTHQLLREFRRLDLSDLRVTNCYGPTEITAATSFETISLATSEDDGISNDHVYSVGKPLPNYSIYIVDEECKPVPAGFPGEICIGGAGVGLGYFDIPELTKAKFLPDPFAAPEDISKGWSRMYRSGDKGLLSQDGSLIFIGRKDGDTQVKLRGLRIELDDVANTLLQVASGVLSEAVVTVRGDAEFQYLVAHVVFAPAQNLSDPELQLLVGNLPLPQYMWPAIIISVDRLPMNSNGKIDREAIGLLPLPTKGHESYQAQRSFTLSEGELGLLWESVLQEAASSLRLCPDSDFFMLGGNSNLLVRLQGVIRDAMGIAIPITEMYQASTLGSMAAHISAKKEQLRCNEAIVWDIETAVPNSMLISSVFRIQEHKRQIEGHHHHNHHRHHREILLTGSTTFLGSAILKSLLKDVRIRRIHCIAVPVENQNALPRSDRIIIYTGSLRNAGLGLSQTEYIKLQSCTDLIIHAGALGHCLNNYSSLRVPNFHSTRFLATLALHRHIPVHFISSNRVTLLAGNCTALPPVSISSYPPATDGSEGFTAAKWASERFLENVARETGLDVCVHRACAVVGDDAPNDDALNALLRYSMLMRAVPQFHNFDGFFDFKDVHDVANEIALEALTTPCTHEILAYAANDALQPAQDIPSLRFRHHSSGVRVPVQQFRQHMELIHECRFHELSMAAWIERARELGIEVLITRYLEALVEREERVLFPYLGGVEE